jgi:hypothetical protein
MTDAEEPDFLERDEFGSLEFWFFGCSALRAPGREGAERLCTILQDAAGLFVRTKPEARRPTWEPDPAPSARVESDGGFSSLDFAHPLLGRTILEPTNLHSLPPTCALTYRPGLRLVIFSQSASQDEPENLDALARGQLALARKLLPRLRPRFAFIDEVSDGLDEEKVLVRPLRKSVRILELPYIFWGNFWSRGYVEKLGADLVAAPGWVNRKLPGSCLLYVATRSFFRWWTRPPVKIRKYFRRTFPVFPYNTNRLIAGADPFPDYD